MSDLTQAEVAELEADKELLIDTTLNGEAAKMFLESDFGQYLLGCAIQERDAAVAKMINADVNNVGLMQEIKEGMRVPVLLSDFIARAIKSGDEAAEEYAQKYMEK